PLRKRILRRRKLIRRTCEEPGHATTWKLRRRGLLAVEQVDGVSGRRDSEGEGEHHQDEEKSDSLAVHATSPWSSSVLGLAVVLSASRSPALALRSMRTRSTFPSTSLITNSRAPPSPRCCDRDPSTRS